MASETVTLHDGTECDLDDAVFVEAHDAYYPADGCVLLRDGTYRPTDECVLCYDDTWCPAEESVTLLSGESAHEDDDDIVCLQCGDYTHKADATLVDGDWYLSDDVVCCSSCNDSVLADNALSTPCGNDYLCSSCHDDDVVTCNSCNEEVWRNDAHYVEYDCYCESCHEDAAKSDLVLDYSDKSSVHLPSDTPRNLRTIGIELEVESKTTQHEAAEFARQTLPDRYCVFKEDGSLASGGFEIVTRWDSADVHAEHFRRFFDSEPHRHMTSWQSGSCGMHVHVAKSSLTPLQIGKIMCFINDLDNKAMVVHVAGRQSGYATLSPKKVSDALKPDYRRAAINVTPFSAEFRIFRGTLKPAGFYRNLEFVQAVVRFCEPAARSIADATSAIEFCKWLPKADYPHLHAHLVRGGFIKGDASSESEGDQ